MPVRACYGVDALDHVRARVRECEDAGVSLMCCPEGALGGLADYVDAPDDIVIPSDSKSLASYLRPLVSKTVAVVVGFTESDETGRYYNAAAVYAGGRIVGVYRKQRTAIHGSRYSAGSETPVFLVNGIPVGILICRDSTDPQLWTTLVERGARLLCIPTNNAMPPNRGGPELVEEARTLDAQQAMQHGVTVLRADVVGTARGLVSAGASVITGSDGVCTGASGTVAGELVVAGLTADLAQPLSAP